MSSRDHGQPRNGEEDAGLWLGLHAVIALIGLAALAGWAWDIPMLVAYRSGGAPVMANEAVAIVLMAAGLRFACLGRWDVARMLARVVFIYAMLVLVELATGVDLGIDELLVRHDMPLDMEAPGRMGPNAALCLAFGSAALGLLMRKGARSRDLAAAAVFSAASMAVAFLAAAGYLTGLRSAVAWGGCTGLSLPAALAHLLLGASLFVKAGGAHGRDGWSRHRAAALFSAALLVLAVVGFISNRGVSRVEGGFAGLERSLRLSSGIESVRQAVIGLESASRGYVVLQDDAFRQAFDARAGEARASVQRLREGFGDRPDAAGPLGELGRLVESKIAFNEWLVNQRSAHGIEECMSEMRTGEGVRLAEMVNATLDELKRIQCAHHMAMVREEAAAASQTRGVLILGHLFSGFLIVLALVLAGRADHRRRAALAAIRESEARYRAALDVSFDAFLFLQQDRDGGFTIADLNSRAATWLGTTRDDVLGAPFPGPGATEARRQLAGRWSRAVADGHPVEEEHSEESADGRMLWYRQQIMPGSGGVAVALRDITQAKGSEQRLQALAVRLKRRQRELEEFAGAASHDMQEPLREIEELGGRLAEAADEEEPPAVRLENCVRVQEAARRMRILINDLAAYLGIGMQGRPLENVPLGRVLGEVVSGLGGRIRETQAAVRVGTLPDVRADAGLMRQLFHNLLENALEYRRPGVPPDIWITSRVPAPAELQEHGLRPGRACTCVEVSDNGAGFDSADMERIFTAFRSQDAARRRRGSGVGLAICRKIVEHHGGAIWAEGESGRGARFTLCLPLEGPRPEDRQDF